MQLKSKNAESLVMAHVEVRQPSKREIRDDSPKLVDVSRVLARRFFLLRDQHNHALRDQQCADSCLESHRFRVAMGTGAEMPAIGGKNQDQPSASPAPIV